jgi:hypothetical protein
VANINQKMTNTSHNDDIRMDDFRQVLGPERLRARQNEKKYSLGKECRLGSFGVPPRILALLAKTAKDATQDDPADLKR